MRVRDSLRTLEREGSGRKTEEVVVVETVPASHILVKPLQMSCSVYPENWATKARKDRSSEAENCGSGRGELQPPPKLKDSHCAFPVTRNDIIATLTKDLERDELYRLYIMLSRHYICA